jgi:hypothetical protein
MTGKTIEESQAVCKLTLEKKGLSTMKVPVTMKDVCGHVFTIIVDSETTSIAPIFSEFAGLTSDPIPTTISVLRSS